jgi:adenylate cyclase
MTIPPKSGKTPTATPVRLSIKKCAISCLLLLTGLLPTLVITVLCVFPPPVLPDINLRIYDYYLLSYRSPAGADAPLIVDIDARSLKEYGQWPWPRFRVAELMEKISEDAPLAVGVDIIFSEPDRTSLENIYEDIETHFDVRIKEDQGVPEYLRNNDAFLANALKQGEFITSMLFTYGEKASDDNCILHPLNLTTQLAKNASYAKDLFPPPDGTICNLPILSDAVNMNGFLNVKEDPDGILRRAPMLIKYQGKLYPHLSLATLITALKPKTRLLKISKFGIEGLILDDRFIPLDPKGNFAVNFRSTLNNTALPSFEYISAADLLNGNVPSEKFKNKIVFLGTSAAGLNDIHHIPGDYVFPGVEFHANVVDNILSNTFLPHPHWAKGMEIGVILSTGLTIAFLFFRFGAKTGLLTFILSGIFFFRGAGRVFASYGIFISPLYPIMALALNFFLIFLIKFYRSDLIQRRRKKEIFLMQEAMLETITMLTEARDQETGGHIRRTQGYIKIMAEELQKTKKYSKILTPEETEVICKVAPLHDVGKIGIPDSILLKPGRLTKEEFEKIKKHTHYGKQIIETALNRVGRNYFLEKALEIAYTHQEKWDGSGYPQGLSGEAIPLSGRIMAISDVYDALTSRRPYKTPVRHEKAVAIMKGDSGTHFDPDLIEVFMRVHERFRKIAIKYAESEQERALLSGGEDLEEDTELAPAVVSLK